MFFKTRNILNKNDLTCEGTVYMKIREKVSKNKKNSRHQSQKLCLDDWKGTLALQYTTCTTTTKGWKNWSSSLNLYQYESIYCYFWMFSFFNSVQLFDDKYFFTEDNFGPPELRSVGILRLSLTVWEIKMFEFSTFWQCASKCIRNIFALKVSFKN